MKCKSLIISDLITLVEECLCHPFPILTLEDDEIYPTVEIKLDLVHTWSDVILIDHPAV